MRGKYVVFSGVASRSLLTRSGGPRPRLSRSRAGRWRSSPAAGRRCRGPAGYIHCGDSPVGEWTMLGARTTAAASHTFGVGLAGAIGIGCTAMVALALFFNRLVLRPLLRRSLLSLIMLTIGVGMFMRASATVVFSGVPSRLA